MLDVLGDKFDKYLREYKPDRLLFEEGTKGDSFYLIREGLVSIRRRDSEDESFELATAGPGEVVGEMALIEDDSLRSATVRSVTELSCWEFNRKQFDALLQESEEFRDQLLVLLSDRLRESNDQLLEKRRRDNLLYQASGLLLFVIDDKDLYDAEEISLDFSPEIRSLRSIFNLSSDVLETLLAHLSLEEMRQLSRDVQETLVESAARLLETGFDVVHFETPFTQAPDDVGSDIVFKSVDDAIESAKILYSYLQKKSPETIRTNRESARKDYEAIRDKYESVKRDPTLSKQKAGQLKAYLEGIQAEFVEHSILEAKEE